jgi:hypothetical protein
MGSPLGPLLADIFLGYMETFHLSSHEFSPSHYFRFVDDTFTIFSSHDHIQPFLNVLNRLHPNLHFTHELENFKRLSFLDVTVHRIDSGPPLTSIFRKPTWSGLYLHFLSSVPVKYKRNLVFNLFNRASRLCSPQLLKEEQTLLRKTLQENGYPIHFIDRFCQPSIKRDDVVGPEKKSVFLFVPFRSDSHSSFLQRRIRDITAQTFPAADPKIIFTTKAIGIRSSKDTVPLTRASQVIYNFSCNCGSRYVGRTSRNLSERISEHLPQWFVAGGNERPRSRSEPPSAITRHAIGCRRFDRTRPRGDYFSIVTHARSKAMLPLLEACVIKSQCPDLCAQKDFLFSLCLPW